MNTGAHLLINWALLNHTPWGKMVLAILLGALLPDALMFVFYAYQKFILGLPEQQIWQEAYYQAVWQNSFDLFNSVPIIVVIFVFAWYKKWLFLQALSLSMLIHCALDFPFHHDDAHRHFLPITNWRFESPVSYWDPAHYGQYIVCLEMFFIVISFIWLVLKRQEKIPRMIAIILLIINIVFFIFAALYWGT